MLLNQVAKRFGSLVGKGLEWAVVAEVFVLSVPFIVAMTLPMAVLVAALYAFTHLAADNEITALRASGVSVARILRPVLLWGVAMAAVNFLFVDQVLPRSNARLRGLLFEIQRKKPTFKLEEQVINEIPQSDYRLRASRIDPATGRMRGVTIYDLGGPGGRRVIYADSGLMAWAPNEKDLVLRLWDGTVHELRSDRPESFYLTRFSTSRLRVADVADRLERSASDVIRGDREMSTCEMLAVARDADRDVAQARLDRAALVERDLRRLLGLEAVRPPADVAVPPPGAYCRIVDGLLDRAIDELLPETVEAQTPAQAARSGATGKKQPEKLGSLGDTGAVRLPSQRAVVPAPPAILGSWSESAALQERIKDARRRANRYMVEVHKKWAISAACITFVIIGVVLALRFPRAGMGLVIGGGMAVFSVFYVGLTAGESLADRSIVSPGVAMWWPNALLLAVGLLGLSLVNRVGGTGSTRGGDFAEIGEWLRGLIERRRRRA
jgi:lipopolysaccharide export system permease protein